MVRQLFLEQSFKGSNPFTLNIFIQGVSSSVGRALICGVICRGFKHHLMPILDILKHL